MLNTRIEVNDWAKNASKYQHKVFSRETKAQTRAQRNQRGVFEIRIKSNEIEIYFSQSFHFQG